MVWGNPRNSGMKAREHAGLILFFFLRKKKLTRTVNTNIIPNLCRLGSFELCFTKQ